MFKNMSNDMEELPATNMFVFLQEVFKIETVSILIDEKTFFSDDENQSNMEKLI
jgi:hypothetical protein